MRYILLEKRAENVTIKIELEIKENQNERTGISK